MIQELGRTTDERSETFNGELGDIKKSQGELRNTVPALKNTLEHGIDSRLQETEGRVRESGGQSTKYLSDNKSIKNGKEMRAA